jgi:hypothetical protein
MPEHQQMQSKKPDSTFQKQATLTSQTHVSHPDSIIQRYRINPKSLTSADVLQLQRIIGNRAVGRLLSGMGNTSTIQQVPIQRQDILEEEEPLQGMFESKLEDETCPSCMQRQEIPDEEKSPQGKIIETFQRQEIPEEGETLQTKRVNNTGMPDNLKDGVENLSGIDMSDVRVHYNSSKPAEVGALAYTQGTNIHVAPGQERHLPHEAWHVVQQAQGRVQPTKQMKDGVPINDDEGLEHEADVMGEKGQYNSITAQGQQLLDHELTNLMQQRATRVSNLLGLGVAVAQDQSIEAKVNRMGLRVYSYGVLAQAKMSNSVQGIPTIRAMSRFFPLVHARVHIGEASQVMQCTVDRGLPEGTIVIHNGKAGIVMYEKVGVGYIVRFKTVTKPEIYWVPAPIPYEELDLTVAANAAVGDQEMEQESGESDDAKEKKFNGMLEDLPESISLGGITYQWVQQSSAFILKPADSGFPHITFPGNHTNLEKLHFTSAQVIADEGSEKVEIIRKGYAWDGMRSKLVDDPEFAENVQYRPITRSDSENVWFDLSGGRKNMVLKKTAKHTETPQVAQLAAALGIPS